MTIEPVRVEHRVWGLAPVFALTIALGLVVISLAYAGARQGAPWSSVAFWAGMLLLFVPVAIRQLMGTVSRNERGFLVVALGVGLYLVKVLLSPSAFNTHDEFAHWRTTLDIFQSQRLFSWNPLLPVTAVFPGLASATHALASMSGLSVFAAGSILIGVARAVMMLALFRFCEEVSHSSRIAGLTSLLYMSNPNFVFFDAHFAYEPLALSFVALALLCAVQQARHQSRTRLGWAIVALILIAAASITHHVSSYMLVGFLAIWFAVSKVGYVFQRTAPLLEQWAAQPYLRPVSRSMVAIRELLAASVTASQGVGVLALFGGVVCVAWLISVAGITWTYLGYILRGGLLEFVQLLSGLESGRQLFRSFTGEVAPIWERSVGFASVGLILAGLPVGLLYVWHRYKGNLPVIVLSMAALTYPITLALRLITSGAEISQRSSEFLFLAVGLVLAIGIAEVVLPRLPIWKGLLGLGALISVIFVGGIIVGGGAWSRMPGPYLVVADSRSIEPEGIAAATWAQNHLGPDERMATDRINQLLMGTYGHQHPVTNSGDGVNVSTVFFSTQLQASDVELLRRGQVHYLVVDRRLSTALPMIGVYFETGEPNGNLHRVPIAPQSLSKFDHIPGVDRIFDSGNIIIYGVSNLWISH